MKHGTPRVKGEVERLVGQKQRIIIIIIIANTSIVLTLCHVLCFACINLFFFFFKFYLFTYLFVYLLIILAALGLCCCVRAFSSCCERGLLFVVVHGLLIAVASPVAEHRL